MVLGKVKKLFKKALTITLAAAMVATSVPQLSVEASAQEITLDAEGEESVSTEGVEDEDSVSTDGVEDGETVSGNDSGDGDNDEDTTNMALRYEVTAVDLTAEEPFKNLVQQSFEEDFKTITGFNENYVLSYDIYLPKDASFEGSFDVETVTQLTNTDKKWAWTKGESTSLTIESFSECAENSELVKYSFSGKFGTGVTAYTSIDAVVVNVGSSTSTYNGVIFIDNLKVLDADGKEVVVQNFNSYEGAVELGNMEGITTGGNTGSGDDGGDNGNSSGNTSESENVVYTSTNSVAKEIDFSDLTKEDWGNRKVTVAYAYTNTESVTVSESFTVDAKITINADAYATLTAGNYIKFQGVVKLDSWEDYRSSTSWPQLKAEDFTQDGDNYTASIQCEFKDKGPGALWEIDFEIVGVGFEGTINISDVKVENVPAVYTVVVYENTKSIPQEIDFADLQEENWGDRKVTVAYEYTNDNPVTLSESFTIDAKITINADAYATLTDGNYIKFQGAVKLDSWNGYKSSTSWPQLEAGDFTWDGENYTASIQCEFKDRGPGELWEIDFEIVGVGFKGTINISDVKVSNITTQKPALEEKDPTILSDLSTEEDYKRWSTEAGYEYKHGDAANTDGKAVPVIDYDSENQRLKVTLDYSANASSEWSEAKVKFTPDTAADVSQYNQLSVDFIYPDELDGTKMQFYADDGAEKDEDKVKIIYAYTTVDESTAETLADGMKKVTVTMSFSPTSTPLESVTIGIIGVSTSFKGDVYLDNLVLSQKNVTEDFIEITSAPGEGSAAKLENKPASIKISDANADENAKALYTYLKTLANDDQVLFGHQNDVNKQVSTSAELGDVYDITGQISGLFGIDTLSLTGSEAGGTDAKTALENSVIYSKQAAENGAIVTLSAHMPNVSNSKVVQNEDGTYDFFKCDFAESKDLSNDIAKKVLPGGEYNVVYKAYLDIIVDYATQLQEEGIPIIFRPLHENTGNWFWWGSSNTAETYKSLYRYTKDYIESKGVHNMLWVYSPNGPLTSEAEYLSYYPGDEYVDILAFDYYDDYNTYPATSDGSFFTNLDTTCEVVAALAEKKGKIPAISECGVRVMKKDGSDIEGLLVKGNPVGTAASGKNWYSEVNKIAQQNNMPYFLVWANFSDTNFYVPYKYNDTYGHELINDFIDFYNEDSSIFGTDANFYANKESLASTTTEKYTNQMGYMVSPFDGDTVLEPTQIKAVVENAKTVQFVVTDTNAEDKTVTLDATADAEIAGLWSAELTDEAMQAVGKTEVAAITLKADGVELAKISNISLGKEKEKAPANVIENFDYYSGSDGLLDATYTSNSAAGCSSSFTLDTENKADGTYGGAFNYKLVTTGSEVWTGRIKADLVSGDFSAYNALEMWVKPDGKGQKLVVQLTDASGEEFEVYLTDFVKGTEAKYIVIPFSSFKGKKNGTLDTANITKFAIWCNSIVPEGHEGTWTVDSAIYFDGIQAVKIADGYKVDQNGLIINEKSEVNTSDKTELNALIAQCKEMTQGNYTDESWKVFTDALAAAEAVAIKDNVTQEEVNAAKEALQKAVIGLKTSDKTELNALIAQYKELAPDNYTDKSWKVFTDALAAAEAVAAKEDATQEEVDAAKEALQKAVAGLKEKEDESVEIPEGLWIEFLDGREYSYTGKAIKPEIEVYDGADLLVEKKDYTVTYKNNVKVGEATVIVKGKGNYNDKTEAAFTINKKDLGDADITAEDVVVIMNEDGSIPASKVAVKFGKTTLKEGANKDYTVEWPEVTAKGKYEITIKATENSSKYTGSKKIAYVVLDSATILMSKVTVKLDTTKVDYGKANPVVTEVSSGRGAKKVTYTEGTDYTVVYPETQVVGKNNVISIVAVEGGKLYGTKNVAFTVNGKKLKAIVTLDKETWSYTGEQIKPVVAEVKDNSGNVLVANKDYVVTYDKNINQGKGKVFVKGCGAYTGTITKTFKIEKVDLTTLKETTVIAKEAVYSKTGAKPSVVITFNGKALVENQDYTVSYKNNKKVDDTVKVTIKGKGNFAGQVVNEEAKVVVSSKDNVTFAAADVCITKNTKANKVKPKLTIVETATNKKLTAKTDYDKTIKYYSDEACTTGITDADVVADKVLYAQITLTSNYGSTAEQPVKMVAPFRLYTAKASSFKVTDMPKDLTYTGKAIEPKFTVIVKEDGTDKVLTEGVDYKVTYTNNVKVGTAKATITGIGNGYGGTKTVTFKIKPQKLQAGVFGILTDSVKKLLSK